MNFIEYSFVIFVCLTICQCSKSESAGSQSSTNSKLSLINEQLTVWLWGKKSDVSVWINEEPIAYISKGPALITFVGFPLRKGDNQLEIRCENGNPELTLSDFNVNISRQNNHRAVDVFHASNTKNLIGAKFTLDLVHDQVPFDSIKDIRPPEIDQIRQSTLSLVSELTGSNRDNLPEGFVEKMMFDFPFSEPNFTFSKKTENFDNIQILKGKNVALSFRRIDDEDPRSSWLISGKLEETYIGTRYLVWRTTSQGLQLYCNDTWLDFDK